MRTGIQIVRAHILLHEVHPAGRVQLENVRDAKLIGFVCIHRESGEEIRHHVFTYLFLKMTANTRGEGTIAPENRGMVSSI